MKSSNLLIVGVGGIGCELIKVLSKSGFNKFTLIDLDTIEVTNLNRQFYFRREHVGRSKAEVGRESILKLHPNLEIEAYQASIYEHRFDAKFYSKFDVVICALDNINARNWVSKNCVQNHIPMIDSGT